MAVNVLVLGIDGKGIEKNIIQLAGGNNVKITMDKDVKGSAFDAFAMGCFDLIIFVIKEKDAGSKMIVKLKEDWKLKAMMVGVLNPRKELERKNLIKAGLDNVVVEPINNHQMEAVFKQLEKGMKKGTYKKPSKVLVLGDQVRLGPMGHLFNKAGVLVSLLSDVNEVADLKIIKLGFAYDFIFICDPKMVRALKNKAVTSVLVGVAERNEFDAVGVDKIIAKPLTVEKIGLIVGKN